MPSLSNQKQLFVAVHASDVYNLCGSDAHATTGASVFAAAALSGSHTDEGRDTVVSAGTGNLKTAELIPIDKNVGQVVLQNELQEVITGTGNRPTVFLMMIHDQTVCGGGSPELAVVVGVTTAAILNALHMVVVVNHLMKESRNHFLDGSGESTGSNVDFVGSSQLGNPGVFSQREVSVSLGSGLNCDGGS